MLLSHIVELIVILGPYSCFHDGFKNVFFQFFSLGIHIKSLYCIFIYLFLLRLIYKVLLVSSVQQSDSVIYIFFQILFHYSLLQDVEYSSLCYIVDPCCLSIFFLIFIYLFIYLFIHPFIHGCVGSSFLCEGPPQLRQAGATLHRGAQASHHRGLSRRGAQAPDAQAQQLWLTGPVAPRHVGSSQTRARTRVPCTGRRTLNHCATREALSILYIVMCICLTNS